MSQESSSDMAGRAPNEPMSASAAPSGATPAAPPPAPPPPPTPAAPVAPAPAAPKRRGCAIWVLAALAFVFLSTTLLLALLVLGFLATGDTGSGSKPDRLFTEQTVAGEGPHKVLMVPINGIIADASSEDGLLGGPGESMVALTREMLRAARRDSAVRAVILSIDSPGGGITASDVLYHEIVAFRKDTGKPVIALMGDVAASGGYYVAAAADQIIAHPTTITGSIGVILPLYGIEDLLGKIGITPRPIKSGEFKDIGSFTRAMKSEERDMLNRIVMEYRDQFVSVVFAGMQNRKVPITREKLDAYCDGRVFTAKEAQALGFVDALGYFEDAVAATCAQAGIPRTDTRVITYRRKSRLLEMLFSQQAARHPQAVTLRLDGLTPARSGRFMYLWQPGESAAERTARE